MLLHGKDRRRSEAASDHGLGLDVVGQVRQYVTQQSLGVGVRDRAVALLEPHPAHAGAGPGVAHVVVEHQTRAHGAAEVGGELELADRERGEIERAQHGTDHHDDLLGAS